jgi:hypothetical protein
VNREAAAEVYELAAAQARSDDDDALRAELAYQVVNDLALTEGGWMQRFITARGAQLPDDESLLVTSWLFCRAPSTRSSQYAPAMPPSTCETCATPRPSQSKNEPSAVRPESAPSYAHGRYRTAQLIN